VSDPFRAQRAVSELLEISLQNHRINRQMVTFNVELSPGKQDLAASVSTLINRCWDGLRVLPYPSNEIVSSIALTAALLCARAEKVPDVDKWPEKLWGETELLEIAPAGGHLEIGWVSKSSLALAFSSEHLGSLTRSMRRIALDRFNDLMTYIVDPWLLFNFRPFRKMFVEQFVPTAVGSFWKEDLNLFEGSLESMWSLSFNPALLGFVTNNDYRFDSPSSLEPDVDKVIYITPEMDRDDIEEAFISCLPSILAGSKPYRVKFTDYNHDSRELWQIDRVICQTQGIVELGGISVLEVFTSLTDEENETHHSLFRGLGAFEIWLIAKRQLQLVQGTPIDSHPTLLHEFWSALLASNEQLENRARSMPDWLESIARGKDSRIIFPQKQNTGSRIAARKVGRNELCPCGSASKYKQCCGK
jgi:hypothetical protein